jgi:Leucine-rich repeat (LRR) protein
MPSDSELLASLRRHFTYSPKAEYDAAGRMIKLDLAGVEMQALPPQIGQFTALQELRLGFLVEDNGLRWEADIRYNRLDTLPEEIGNLQQLRVLTLGSNRLSSLPASFARLQNLTELDLQDNPLGSLPQVLCQLRNLQRLNLCKTRLNSLPEHIGQLPQLQSLQLQQNHLTALPQPMANLQALEILNLSGNPFASVPRCLLQLTRLRELRLFGCTALGPVPDEFLQMPALEVLWVKHNLLQAKSEPSA